MANDNGFTNPGTQPWSMANVIARLSYRAGEGGGGDPDPSLIANSGDQPWYITPSTLHLAASPAILREFWQLPWGYYEPSKYEPVVVFPRPDAETPSWARHRLAPDGVLWQCPIGIHSGSWPFYYDIDAASKAKGITIGHWLEEAADGTLEAPANYGVIEWAEPTIGAHEIHVTVKTQEYGRNTSGHTDLIQFTITLVVADRNDTTKFIFISGAGSDTTGTGSHAAPFRTYSKARESGDNAGKQLHMLAGSYDTTPLGGTATNFSVVVGHDAPTLSMTGTGRWSTGPDYWTSGYEITDGGAHSTDENRRIFTSWNGDHRCTFFDMTFTNPPNGTVGNDNPSSIFSSGGGNSRDYIFIRNCRETGRAHTSNSAGLYVLFGAGRVVSEFNSCTGGDPRTIMLLKDGNQDCTVRANYAEAGPNNTNGTFSTGCQIQQAGIRTERIEISHNRTNGRIGVAIQHSHDYGEHQIFRNNCGSISVGGSDTYGNGMVILDKNACNSEATGTQIDNLHTECVASGSRNAEYKLTGSYRTDWLGRRGAEIVMPEVA